MPLLPKVKLTEAVIEGIEEVRSGGQCSMFDIQCVQLQLVQLGHLTAARWVLTNRRAYNRLVFTGYEEVSSEEEQDTDRTLPEEPIE